MGVVLVRIDDRLVHGQVIEGWLKAIHVDQLVVASDAVATDETQTALYLLAVPHGVTLSCVTVAEAAQRWKTPAWSKSSILVLVSSPQDVLALIQKGAQVNSVNVGGMHYREGRTQILKAISVDENDIAVFRELLRRGVMLEVRALPLEEPVALASYIERWAQDHEALKDQPR